MYYIIINDNNGDNNIIYNSERREVKRK